MRLTSRRRRREHRARWPYLLVLALAGWSWHHTRATRALPAAAPPLQTAAVPVAAVVPVATAEPMPLAAPVTERVEPLAAPPAALELIWSPEADHGLRVADPVPLPTVTGDGGAAANDAVREGRAATQRNAGNSLAWRRLGDACVACKLYSEAVVAYRREAALYRQRGDIDGALVQEAKADGWDSTVVIYRDQPAAAAGKLAKFEPAAGCYIGANVESDPRVRGDYPRFGELTGRGHAIYFDYLHYGQRFPSAWAKRAAAVGAGIQIAWEPNRGLGEVADNAYLQTFARDAAAAGTPVWLRFASEMNGDWTAWSVSPERFKASWRTVAGVMKRLAPNVAMVWAPNALPETNITAYYPGDEWVDWVGVNFYAVHHHDNDIKVPADREDPSDLPRFVYRTYAARKPIMVCETAATHFCRACGKDVTEFCRDRIGQLYGALPRRYPRIKAICWYDINNLTNNGARSERRTNNFSLTDSDRVLEAYRRQVATPYYLSTVITDAQAPSPARPVGLDSGTALAGRVRLSAWVRAWQDRPTVIWKLDGKPLLATSTRPFDLEWDTTKAKPGPHTVEAVVVLGGRGVARSAAKVTVGAGL
ncbi:MAG: hypothetical protein HZB16_07770 [Armatimonadetes bacterium]|nr:hypothetical protein [Armatimonadota bacterium]